MSITILLFGHNVSFKRYWQFKIIWFPLSCHHSNRTISLSHKRCIHNSHIKYENASKYIYPLNEIVSLSHGQGDHESQRDNFESLGHCWYYLDISLKIGINGVIIFKLQEKEQCPMEPFTPLKDRGSLRTLGSLDFQQVLYPSTNQN